MVPKDEDLWDVGGGVATNSSHPNNHPSKGLSWHDIEGRHAKGLCFNCDEALTKILSSLSRGKWC